jgi:hypothetical protein
MLTQRMVAAYSAEGAVGRRVGLEIDEAMQAVQQVYNAHLMPSKTGMSLRGTRDRRQDDGGNEGGVFDLLE